MIGKLMARKAFDRIIAAGLRCFIALEDRDTAIDVRVLALQYSDDEAVAILVVNEWIRTQKEWPVPADLYERIESANEAARNERQKIKTESCVVCHGTGLEIVERGGLSGARVCRCRGGEKAA